HDGPSLIVEPVISIEAAEAAMNPGDLPAAPVRLLVAAQEHALADPAGDVGQPGENLRRDGAGEPQRAGGGPGPAVRPDGRPPERRTEIEHPMSSSRHVAGSRQAAG